MIPVPVWSIAVQYNVAFAPSPFPPHHAPSPALHFFSSALSSLPPVFLYGSLTGGGTHLHLPLAVETKVRESVMNGYK